MRDIHKNIFSYFYIKVYVVDIHKKCLKAIKTYKVLLINIYKICLYGKVGKYPCLLEKILYLKLLPK